MRVRTCVVGRIAPDRMAGEDGRRAAALGVIACGYLSVQRWREVHARVPGHSSWSHPLVCLGCWHHHLAELRSFVAPATEPHTSRSEAVGIATAAHLHDCSFEIARATQCLAGPCWQAAGVSLWAPCPHPEGVAPKDRCWAGRPATPMITP